MKLKKLFIRLVLIGFAATLFAACRTTPPPVSMLPERDYLLGSEDVIEVTVWKEEDLSKEVTIRPDGKLSLPLIGDIQVAAHAADGFKRKCRFQRHAQHPNRCDELRHLDGAVHRFGRNVAIGREGRFFGCIYILIQPSQMHHGIEMPFIHGDNKIAGRVIDIRHRS